MNESNIFMDLEPDIAGVAALLGDATRARICLALCGGRPLPAGELALRSGVSAQTASNHLAKLREGGLVTVEPTARCRYYCLARPEVARALEALALAASPRPAASSARADAIRNARTCYDHLAGRLGVALAEAMAGRGWVTLSETSVAVTPKGEHALASFGIDVAPLRQARRPFHRICIDWSERRPHLAGGLGAALLDRLVALRWVERLPKTRAIRITAAGKTGIRKTFGFAPPTTE